jgi:hypothetical protein
MKAILGCIAALLAGCASYDYGYGVGDAYYDVPGYYAYSTPSHAFVTVALAASQPARALRLGEEMRLT